MTLSNNRSLRRALAYATAAVVGLTATVSSAQTLTTEPGAVLAFSTYLSGLSQPTDIRFLPDGRAVITEKTGALKVRKADGTVVTAGTLSVDTESEKGLLGIAIASNFASTKLLYLYYSRSDTSGGTDLDRHRVVSMVLKDDNTLDLASEKVLVSGLRGPANHDGGALEIHKNQIYIGTGDTGNNSGKAPEPIYTPTNFFGTCLSNGNGKILRVNLDGSIPSDNPLVPVATATACGTSPGVNISTTGTAAPRKDIYAWGFRNAWRFWMDPTTDLLWVGDVGEVTFEEIDIVQKGKHYGWPWREGAKGHDKAKCKETSPDVGDCEDPAYVCRHGSASGGIDGECSSITGGLIHDSCTWPAAYRNLYWFTDYVSNGLFTLTPTADRKGIAGARAKLGTAPKVIAIRSDGTDIYFVAVDTGRINKLAPKVPITCGGDAGPADTGPRDTGPADTGLADTSVPDTSVPDTTVADTSAADTSVAADTGSTSTDTGSPATDTDLPGTDSGSPTSDATPTDGALVDGSVDGSLDDGGVVGGTDEAGGCGCTTPRSDEHPNPLLLVGVAGLALALARRKRSE